MMCDVEVVRLDVKYNSHSWHQVFIAEQNWDNTLWQAAYSRVLKLKVSILNHKPLTSNHELRITS
jgi:hypothetical protein